MQRKVILSADSPCDLGEELRTRYDVHFFPFHILLGEQSYTDSVDIHPEDLYQAWREKKLLPKTSAITPLEYTEYFQGWVDAAAWLLPGYSMSVPMLLKRVRLLHIAY